MNTVAFTDVFSPIRAPSVYGVTFLKMIEVVGLFPWNTCVEQGDTLLWSRTVTGRRHHSLSCCVHPALPHTELVFVQETWAGRHLSSSVWCHSESVWLVGGLFLSCFPGFDSLCAAGSCPEPLHSGRWPPAPSGPLLWSYPSLEPPSGQGSWRAGST